MTQPRTTLSDLRKLCEKATSGPWEVKLRKYAIQFLDINSNKKLVARVLSPIEPGDEPNAQFIAASRTALPLLLDEITQLREALADSIGTIHGEFCGSNQHHPQCDDPNICLNQSKERLPE